jgi:DNA-binding winged helix-turn-helix (wHTH) protein
VTFDFGPYNLDPAKRLLLRSGEPMPLPPKAFDTLVILLERHERVVSKDELLRTIWPDTVVEEASLSQQIFLLRKTLNSGSEEAEYIATIPRRGYRFVGPIAHVVSSAPAANGSSRRVAWAAGVAMAVGFVARRRSPCVAAILAPCRSHACRCCRRPARSVGDLLSCRPTDEASRSGADPRRSRSVLWIRRFDSPAAAALQGTEEADFPFWSPDGRWLAFFARGKLKKIRADGGLVQVLCDAPWGRGGTWSRDDVIVFAPEPRSALYRVPASGGVPTPVTSLATSPIERSHRFPHFFSDGRHFVYSALRNDNPRAL